VMIKPLGLNRRTRESLNFGRNYLLWRLLLALLLTLAAILLLLLPATAALAAVLVARGEIVRGPLARGLLLVVGGRLRVLAERPALLVPRDVLGARGLGAITRVRRRILGGLGGSDPLLLLRDRLPVGLVGPLVRLPVDVGEHLVPPAAVVRRADVQELAQHLTTDEPVLREQIRHPAQAEIGALQAERQTVLRLPPDPRGHGPRRTPIRDRAQEDHPELRMELVRTTRADEPGDLVPAETLGHAHELRARALETSLVSPSIGVVDIPVHLFHGSVGPPSHETHELVVRPVLPGERDHPLLLGPRLLLGEERAPIHEHPDLAEDLDGVLVRLLADGLDELCERHRVDHDARDIPVTAPRDLGRRLSIRLATLRGEGLLRVLLHRHTTLPDELLAHPAEVITRHHRHRVAVRVNRAGPVLRILLALNRLPGDRVEIHIHRLPLLLLLRRRARRRGPFGLLVVRARLGRGGRPAPAARLRVRAALPPGVLGGLDGLQEDVRHVLPEVPVPLLLDLGHLHRDLLARGVRLPEAPAELLALDLGAARVPPADILGPDDALVAVDLDHHRVGELADAVHGPEVDVPLLGERPALGPRLHHHLRRVLLELEPVSLVVLLDQLDADRLVRGVLLRELFTRGLARHGADVHQALAPLELHEHAVALLGHVDDLPVVHRADLDRLRVPRERLGPPGGDEGEDVHGALRLGHAALLRAPPLLRDLLADHVREVVGPLPRGQLLVQERPEGGVELIRIPPRHARQAAERDADEPEGDVLRLRPRPRTTAPDVLPEALHEATDRFHTVDADQLLETERLLAALTAGPAHPLIHDVGEIELEDDVGHGADGIHGTEHHLVVGARLPLDGLVARARGLGLRVGRRAGGTGVLAVARRARRRLPLLLLRLDRGVLEQFAALADELQADLQLPSPGLVHPDPGDPDGHRFILLEGGVEARDERAPRLALQADLALVRQPGLPLGEGDKHATHAGVDPGHRAGQLVADLQLLAGRGCGLRGRRPVAVGRTLRVRRQRFRRLLHQDDPLRDLLGDDGRHDLVLPHGRVAREAETLRDRAQIVRLHGGELREPLTVRLLQGNLPLQLGDLCAQRSPRFRRRFHLKTSHCQ